MSALGARQTPLALLVQSRVVSSGPRLKSICQKKKRAGLSTKKSLLRRAKVCLGCQKTRYARICQRKGHVGLLEKGALGVLVLVLV